jgi:hypothetical protein
LPLFFFLSAIHGARGQTAIAAKNAPQAAFSFCGHSHISPTDKRAKMGEKSSDNGNGTRNAQRNTRHGSIFRCFSVFYRLGGTLGRAERLKAITSDF